MTRSTGPKTPIRNILCGGIITCPGRPSSKNLKLVGPFEDPTVFLRTQESCFSRSGGRRLEAHSLLAALLPQHYARARTHTHTHFTPSGWAIRFPHCYRGTGTSSFPLISSTPATRVATMLRVTRSLLQLQRPLTFQVPSWHLGQEFLALPRNHLACRGTGKASQSSFDLLLIDLDGMVQSPLSSTSLSSLCWWVCLP